MTQIMNFRAKPRLAISFSGGRSSAVMTKICMDHYRFTHQIAVTFANTGCEHPDTLRFVRDCDEHWGFNTVWLEAQISHGTRKGVRHKIVSYDTASRNGEPFEEYIKKYGIPFSEAPQCTSRLKTEVMESYLRSIGFTRGKKLNYDTAIGIRADEIDRISARRYENRFVYPLADFGWTKQKVIDYMRGFDFDLRIPEHLGNCTWCWKKSLRKHVTIALEHPHFFDFPREMERKYRHLKDGGIEGGRAFFRKRQTVDDIFALAHSGTVKVFTDPNYSGGLEFDTEVDVGSGCSESCEAYPSDGQ